MRILRIHIHFCYIGNKIYDATFQGTNLFIFRICDILLHTKGPVDVERVLVQGEHEDDEDEQRVEHGEEEDHFVPQLLESRGDRVLLGLVGVERVEVLLDQVRPEGDLGPGEVVHLAARENGPAEEIALR